MIDIVFMFLYYLLTYRTVSEILIKHLTEHTRVKSSYSLIKQSYIIICIFCKFLDYLLLYKRRAVTDILTKHETEHLRVKSN